MHGRMLSSIAGPYLLDANSTLLPHFHSDNQKCPQTIAKCPLGSKLPTWTTVALDLGQKKEKWTRTPVADIETPRGLLAYS